MYENIILIFVIIYGLFIGSFLNVVIYRLPHKMSIVSPRSHCPKCNHTLSILDLMPLLSYLLTWGRCRHCKSSISIRYPIVEVLNAISYVLIFLHFGLSVIGLLNMALASIIIAIAYIDYDFKIIPNVLNICIAILALTSILLGGISIVDSLTGCAIGTLIVGFIVCGGMLIKKTTMGMGDLKYVMATGLYLGGTKTFAMIILAVLIAGIFISTMLFLRKIRLTSTIYFGPFLALATYISLHYGNIITHYLLYL